MPVCLKCKCPQCKCANLFKHSANDSKSVQNFGERQQIRSKIRRTTANPFKNPANDSKSLQKIGEWQQIPSKNRRMTANTSINSEKVENRPEQKKVHTSRVPGFRKKSKIGPKTNSLHFSGSQIPEKIENWPGNKQLSDISLYIIQWIY